MAQPSLMVSGWQGAGFAAPAVGFGGVGIAGAGESTVPVHGCSLGGLLRGMVHCWLAMCASEGAPPHLGHAAGYCTPLGASLGLRPGSIALLLGLLFYFYTYICFVLFCFVLFCLFTAAGVWEGPRGCHAGGGMGWQVQASPHTPAAPWPPGTS